MPLNLPGPSLAMSSRSAEVRAAAMGFGSFSVNGSTSLRHSRKENECKLRGKEGEGGRDWLVFFLTVSHSAGTTWLCGKIRSWFVCCFSLHQRLIRSVFLTNHIYFPSCQLNNMNCVTKIKCSIGVFKALLRPIFLLLITAKVVAMSCRKPT